MFLCAGISFSASMILLLFNGVLNVFLLRLSFSGFCVWVFLFPCFTTWSLSFLHALFHWSFLFLTILLGSFYFFFFFFFYFFSETFFSFLLCYLESFFFSFFIGAFFLSYFFPLCLSTYLLFFMDYSFSFPNF